MKSLRTSFSHALAIASAVAGLSCTVNGYASTRMVEAPHFIYEVFTQSFADSNGDGIGDLEGIRSKLDYIAKLGADAIWLTPIFESPSYHGYDVTDYFQIKKQYGTLANLKSLIDSAHARKIKIILDLPVNHTSDQSSWFAEKDHYLFSQAPTFFPNQWYRLQNEFYFSSFSNTMPDLNWKNPNVLTRIEGVFDYWIAQGIDGFRLDAAKFLIKGPHGEQNQPGTHALWQKIADHVGSRTYLIGEIWDSQANIASYYGRNNELDAAFDFPLEGALRSSLANHSNKDFWGALNEKLKIQRSPYFAAPFAGNHDLQRLATALGRQADLQKLAALTVFSLPGTPTVYYGDEIGTLDGDAAHFPGDLAKRTPMNWQTANIQLRNPSSLYATYQNLAQVRKSNPALMQGLLSHVQSLGSTGLSFLREDQRSGTRSLVVLNFGTQPLGAQVLPLAVTSASVLYGSAKLDPGSNSTVQISGLGPKQGVIFALK